MPQPTKLFTTDVLVIGGGIAGLCAANKAVDQGVDVLIADKSTSGFGGQVPSSGGAFPTIPFNGTETYVKFAVEEGEYLNDQDWTYTYANDSYSCVTEMAEWGDLFPRDVSGKLLYKPVRGGGFRLIRTETALPAMLGRALANGAKVLHKVYIADLLTQNGRAVGAVGFHYQTGDFYVVQAKATILGCGGCNYKARRLFHTNCGEGVAMAYNAGAELRNAEFSNTFMISNKYTNADDRAADSVRDAFENALGESLVKRYPELVPAKDPRTPPWMGGLMFKRWIYAMYREIDAGRGPIYLNLTDQAKLVETRYSPRETRHGNRTHGYVRMMQRLGIELTKQKVEWGPVPEFHAGPVRIDVNSATTLPGLYATGDAVQNGSAYAGAYEGCGLGGPLGFVVVSGFRAGIAAGKAVATTPTPEVSTSAITQKKRALFAPMDVTDGYDPYDAIREIQEIVFKLKNSFIKHQDRLKTALSKIKQVQAKLPTLMAKDSHELVRCHEAKSMATVAESLYRASLMRTETRGSNIREDYPERDDANWLKWIIIRKDDAKMRLWTEPVPLDRYKYKPN